jgi:hypothetical protein
MPPPVLLFQMRKLFQPLTRRATLDPSHDFTRCPIRRTTDQDVHVVLANGPFYYPVLKGFARLLDPFPKPLPLLSSEHFVAIFRYPNKVILHLKYRMTPISVVHATAPFSRHILAAKAGGFNLMMDNKKRSGQFPDRSVSISAYRNHQTVTDSATSLNAAILSKFI